MLILGLPSALVCTQVAFAKKSVDNNTSMEKKQAEEGETHTGAAYLGIGVDSLHPALVSHLPKTLVDGQGVLVAQVAPDSPAAKAGIKEHDILVTYQDQKLFSPEQLVKLVQADKPNRKVQLQIVREGKMASYTVTLGERPTLSAANQPAPVPWWQHPWWRELPRYVMPGDRPQSKEEESQSKADSPWKSFDSLTLKKLDDNRYRAEIDYLDKDGQKQHHQFEGTREEIRSQVQAEKDLPGNEREHLLRGLSSQDEPTMPDFWYGPQWSHEFDVMPYTWYHWPGWSSEF
jgi:hypothetical protein